MLGAAVSVGVFPRWRGRLLADISPDAPPTDILPIHVATDFPGLLDTSTPSIQIQISSYPEIIMINRAPYNGQMYVLNSKCTHQGCTVNPWDVDDNILCPCHGSNYNIDGTVIFGAAGPGQPPLATYDFNWDGVDLLQIDVQGLDLAITNTTVQSIAAGNTRLRLDFPGRATSTYQVLYTPDLVTAAQSVQFALTAGGAADQWSITIGNDDTPTSVWVDNPSAQGFYSIELVISQYFQ
jgi:nitrite reductase/ring-hydroxylating ferredoxin subunit